MVERKIFNFRFSIFNSWTWSTQRDKATRGFTLIEVLVIIFLLGIVLSLGGNLFFSILRGGSKAEAVKEIKQNGDYAISVMERMIRNAREASCSDGSVTITSFDGQQTIFSCKENRIASNSAYLTSGDVKADSCEFTCSGTTPEVVTVSFILSPSQTGATSSQKFQTKVSLRTYD